MAEAAAEEAEALRVAGRHAGSAGRMAQPSACRAVPAQGLLARATGLPVRGIVLEV